MTNSIIRSSDLDQVEAIYCHRRVYEKIKKQLDKADGGQVGIFNMFSTPIIVNDFIPPTRVVEGEYIRNKEVLPDDQFCTLVDVDDPPEWAIYFGLVREKVVDNFVMMKKTSYTHNPIRIADGYQM